MLAKITKVIGIGFAGFWLIFTFLEYWQYHEDTRRSIQLFQFSELALILLLLGAAFVFLIFRFRHWKGLQYFSNGLGITGLVCLLAVICMNAFFHKNLGTLLSLGENFTLLGTLLATGSATYLIILISYSIGRLISQAFDIRLEPAVLHLINIALGILFLVFLLFLLGLFGLLSGLVLWPVFVLLLVLSWRSAWVFLKMSLWEPIPAVKTLNAVGLSIFYLSIVLLTMNFMQVVRPYPTGFDAMTYYVNLSSLIRDYHALVEGYGAYNWSLFMALGFLLFDQTSVTLTLSFAGAVLSLFTLYQLSRKWLDGNLSMLVLFLFYSMPMIGWLSYRDMKVDMGLLFYSLLIVLLLYDWLHPVEKKAVAVPAKRKKSTKIKGAPSPELLSVQQWLKGKLPALIQAHPRMVLIGILTGFAVGIKFSALIILLALIPGIAYAKGGRIAFAAGTALILFGVLIARFDAQAALRPLHLWADQLQWLLLLLGIALSGYFFVRQRQQFREVLKLCLICVVCSGLTLSPWLIKNAVETKSVSISSLTVGKAVGPRPSVQDIQRAYENQKNGK